MMESVNSNQKHFHLDEQDLTLGQTLRAARESLNLSIEEIALKTNLKKSHIESIEGDIFILKNVAPTFVRGYVRNYVRFLRLPESLVSSVNYGEVTIPRELSTTTSVNSSSSQGWVLKYLTILVLLVALGMTLLWWWQGYKEEQDSMAKLVGSTVNESKLDIQPQQIVEAQQLNPSHHLMLPTMNDGKLEIESVKNEPVNVLQQVKPNSALSDAISEEAPALISNDELYIEITGSESWISIRDARNKRLAEKLYNHGETLAFNDHEQYRLTIGAPGNVKLYYKGQEVPLKIDGRVARLRLPLQ